LPKAAVPGYQKLPKWDDAIAKSWDRKKHAAHVQQKQESRSEFFKEHDEYLRTPEWRKRRAAVLKRADNLCDGCREAKATEVHHLTYENWKAEFLWELVAICHDCHDRLHIAKAKAVAANAWQPE
jgi:5-methylcytosine-specific restriction endonuclease McrA